MPRKNVEKQFIQEAYYHVYNRGVNKRRIFLDNEDFGVFLNLLKRYLNNEPVKDNKGREYEWLYKKVEILAFCLMPNHFHLLLYQHEQSSITRLMRGILTSYTMYFNKKYKRVGPLFQATYKASMIGRDEYLLHISRYIHLNPKNYRKWEFSSLPYYLGEREAGWVRPLRILELFENNNYLEFLSDYEDHKTMLEEIKSQLAHV